jgi:hypothetical protein
MEYSVNIGLFIVRIEHGRAVFPLLTFSHLSLPLPLDSPPVIRPSLPECELSQVECLSRRGLPFHHLRRRNFAVELRIVFTLANQPSLPRRTDHAVKERFDLALLSRESLLYVGMDFLGRRPFL